ncbi:glutamate-5-semialdehyde dehydrogenase [Marinoscillum furvescens]|uniref:Gamma-glutamyl phosphate reductase n=1 Tax=Marinoscillum furvescens DSM 4134 TaxID=1122208 RepID=A0A3D9L434_MARFU|nr:glutamate-5-semialdehyde dehydrogenase [Marinoscillum furvescens]REE00115.1 glutamate-5-semialdehyde dehydrogenase [Marinoscillum furvescens DSM 4134]
MKEQILAALERTQQASRKLIGLSDQKIHQILNEVADLALSRESEILAANQQDLERMDPQDPKYDRLLLNPERLKGITDDLRNVADLPSPLGKELEKRTLDNGLQLSRRSVPIGVIAVIYESRPNVTFDVFALCLKTGNASVLKGSRDAKDSNLAIVKVIQEVLSRYGLQDIVYLAPPERDALPHILTAEGLIDCAIPRGSQGLIDFVRQNASIPVIETGAGIVHTYVDRSADLAKAKAIVQNAKTRRVSVCNALDCLVLHEELLDALPELVEGMDKAHEVQIFADEQAHAVLKGRYQENLLVEASAEDFGVEWLSHKMSIKVVESFEEALDHIARYSSKHSEAIVAQDQAVVDQFLMHVDAACVYANASTAFSDGAQFGLGAEIGISTQKLHARGPMALREMTSYKWVVIGDGQIRN